jgi:hypothetical protein
VGVGRDAGDPRKAEVERRDAEAELLAEREDEATKAAVYVEAGAAREGELGELGDRVDRPVAVVARRADDRHGALVDQLLDPVGPDQGGLRIHRRVAQLDPEQVTGLVEGGVPGLGLDHVRALDVALGAPLLPVREHRLGDAGAASGGDHPRRLAVADRIRVKEVEGHGDDLSLEAGGTGAHIALKRVLMCEQPERLLEEGVMVAIAAVHRPGAAAALPDSVLLGGHRPQLGEDLLPGAAVVGQRPVHPETLGVRIAVEEFAHALAAPWFCACRYTTWRGERDLCRGGGSIS